MLSLAGTSVAPEQSGVGSPDRSLMSSVRLVTAAAIGAGLVTVIVPATAQSLSVWVLSTLIVYVEVAVWPSNRSWLSGSTVFSIVQVLVRLKEGEASLLTA